MDQNIILCADMYRIAIELMNLKTKINQLNLYVVLLFALVHVKGYQCN